MGDNIKKIKDLTKSLTEDATQLAKQAEAGFKSQWMGVNDRGEAEWGKSPGIYYGTVGLPALADIAKEGVAPEWAKEADEKAARIREAVERKMRIEEPKGFPQHLARAAGEMAAQIPVPGAWMNKLRTAKLAVNEAPSLKRKIALSPIEYFSPIVEVGKAKPTAINYGVGTLFGGGLGYGIEKLTEDKPNLNELISKYGPNYGSEVRDVSKPKQFSKGGDVEDKQELSKLQELTAKYAYDVEKQRKYNTGKYSGKEDEVVKPRRYFNEKLVDIPGDFKSNTIKTPLGDRVIEMYKQFNMPEYREEDVPLKKHLRYYAGGGKAQKLKQGKSAFFSAVDNAISTLKQEKGTPEQMYSLIEKTPGVKKEELERRGIKKKLQGKKSVTKAELETIAKENPAQAPNITRLKPKPTLEDAIERLKEDTGLDDLAIHNIETKLGMKFTLRPSGLALDDGNQSHDLSDLVGQVRAGDIDLSTFSKAEAQDLLNDIQKLQPYYNRRLESKYGQYSLIGKGGERKDYQEVIMSMPTRMQQLREFADQRGITNIQEAEKAWEQEHGRPLPEDEIIGHWKDVPVKNYTVHYRTQSFIDKDGKKVLHVEEIQSDPHQRARDARKDEIKKRMENEKHRRLNQLVKRLEDDPDFLPEDYDFFSINESGEMGGETGLGLFNSRTGEDLGSVNFDLGMTEDEAAQQLKKRFKTQLRNSLKDQVSLSDDEIKAFAKEVPDDFGYMSAEKQNKLDEINKKISRIRDEGLSADELEDYFKPGNIIKSWSGTDKVLGFQRGPKPGSNEWLQEYDKGLAYVREKYPRSSSEQHHEMAVNIANGVSDNWHVKVVEIDPATGREIGAPRTHSTNPSSEVIRQLHSEAADLGGVVSDLPYKKTYDELALKQIIDDAVNQGYDRVSISPGLFQVNRYESAIRSQIDGIEWGPMTDDGRLVSFIKNGRSISDVTVDKNGKVTSGPNEWKGEPLKNVVGDDMASKIIASPERGEFSGEGLTIGAKGFVEFYDKRLPNFLREYLRKEFGADTDRTEFEYGMGDRQKSRYAIEQDIHNRRDADSLTEQEFDDLESHTMDEWYESFNVRARSNGLDPGDPDVEMQAFNDEGIFSGLREQSEKRAISKYVDQIYKAQPTVHPKADVFSFDITPEMSEKVKTQGQRLFAAAPIVALPMAQDDEDKRKVSPSYTIAPEAKTPTLTPQEEQQFQSDVRGTDWFSRFKEKYGEEPNLEDKEYNYRAAWKSGARPQAIEQDDIPHWPSVTSSGESLKARSHPSGWMEDYMQITGRDPSEGGELTPEQIDAMNKSLMYRYGFAGGGRASKMKQVLKKMGVDESKVADKDLITLQDFHTSLGDSIRERAAKMQQQMDAMEFKYEPGQHVFTESSARKNLPPLKILRRTMVGNQPVREPHPDHPLMGKVVKDPETGKTLRTPYEPGYKVRHERSDGWAEYDIPESAIKGAVDFAKGGNVRRKSQLTLTPQEQKIVDYHRNTIKGKSVGMDQHGRPVTVYTNSIPTGRGDEHANVPGYVGGKIRSREELQRLFKDEIAEGKWPTYKTGEEAGRRAAEVHSVMDDEVGEAESVLRQMKSPNRVTTFAGGGRAKKIRELRARIKNEEGEYAAKRLDRAADEVRNLETTFNERALREAFMGDNTKGLAVINPADYEKYAASIPKHGYDETHAGPVYRIGDKAVTYDEYIKYLQNIANTTGLRSVPLLGVDKNKENLLTIPIHEGRHRQRALSGLGDAKSLIQVLTGPSIREPLPRRTKEEGIEAVKSVISKKPAISEDTLRNYKPGQVLTDDELIILPEVFKHGGKV